MREPQFGITARGARDKAGQGLNLVSGKGKEGACTRSRKDKKFGHLHEPFCETLKKRLSPLRISLIIQNEKKKMQGIMGFPKTLFLSLLPFLPTTSLATLKQRAKLGALCKGSYGESMHTRRYPLRPPHRLSFAQPHSRHPIHIVP